MIAVSNSKLKVNSKVSALISQEKLLTNPVNPVSVAESGKEDILLGTLVLSNSLSSPLEAKLKGTKVPSSLSLVAFIVVPLFTPVL